MPVRNEARYIQRSLGAVLDQDYSAQALEVLIVDGVSDDGTADIVRSILSNRSSNRKTGQMDPAVRILHNSQQTASAGLNIGIREARGDIVVVLGGHAVIASDYVRRCAEVLAQTGADCVGGPMATVGETWPARAIALAQSSPFGVGGTAFRTRRSRPGYVDTVAFGAYRREVFDRVGDFDEELIRNQDDEFNFRLVQQGGRIWYDPRIQSVYYSRATLRGLWRQYFQYGLYKVLVIRKRAGVPAWRHLAAPAFVLALMGTVGGTVVIRQIGLALIVSGPYVVANLLASLWAGRRDPAALPLLPLAYATIHLAYGLGFLLGLWHWWRRARLAQALRRPTTV